MKHTLSLLAFITALGVSSAYADVPTLNVCTGNPKLRYAKTAVDLAKQLNGALNFNIVYTAGSMENLRKIKSGECDAALVQSDAYYAYTSDAPDAQLKFEDVGTLYAEQVQLLCNVNAGINTFSDLKTKPETKVAIGQVGSGTAMTWYALTKNPDYGKVNSIPLSGALALTRIINGRDAQCLLVVASYDTDFMKSANELGAGKINIEPIEDSSFLTMKDDMGHPLYVKSTIPNGTYNNIQTGWLNNEVSTIAVRAEFILSTKWYNDHQDVYSDLSTAVLRLGQQLGGVK